MAMMLKDSLRAIQSRREATPYYTELLDILEEILILREEHRRRLNRDVFPVEEKLIPAKLEGGFPLVDFTKADYDLTEAKEYFLDLLKIAERHSQADTGEMAAKIKSGEIDFNDLIYESFNPPAEEDEEPAGDEDGEPSFDLMEMFIEESLRPSLERVAHRFSPLIERLGWSEGYCPICGREPKIGQIRDDEGTRYLFCSQCGFEWGYRRIKCPFCGNEEQQSLAYFSIEEDSRYRVDVCNVCRRYLKIVDFRDTREAVDLDVEDIATIHLDMLANDEGYD